MAEEPKKYAIVVDGFVQWTNSDEVVVHFSGYGHNTYEVTSSEDGRHHTVESTVWYDSDGKFSLTISFVDRNQAVMAADAAAERAGEWL